MYVIARARVAQTRTQQIRLRLGATFRFRNILCRDVSENVTLSLRRRFSAIRIPPRYGNTRALAYKREEASHASTIANER